MRYIVELNVDTEALEIGMSPKAVAREIKQILEAAHVDRDQVWFNSIRESRPQL